MNKPSDIFAFAIVVSSGYVPLPSVERMALMLMIRSAFMP